MPGRDGSRLFSEETLPERDLAYIAGLFDGEGCVVIGDRRKKGRVYSYALQVKVEMTDARGPKAFATLFGGRCIPRKPPRPHWSPKTTWRLTGRRALRFLRAVRPFLKVKREAADIGIRFMEEYWQPKGTPLSPARLDLAKRLKAKLSQTHPNFGSRPGRPGKRRPALQPTLL